MRPDWLGDRRAAMITSRGKILSLQHSVWGRLGLTLNPAP